MNTKAPVLAMSAGAFAFIGGSSCSSWRQSGFNAGAGSFFLPPPRALRIQAIGS